MPRSRRLRSLANCLRALGLLAALVALATALGIRYGGERVDAIERDLQRWLHAPVERALAAAQSELEPERRATLYAELLEQLGDTQREDRDAEVVRTCYQQLADLAEARGDLARATEWQRARHEFDDRDLFAAVRYAELLCKKAATADQGRTRLRLLATRFPGHALVVTALVEQALSDGNPHHARAALAAAARAPRSNLWHVTRESGAAIDLVPVRTDAGLQLRFRLEPPCRQLRVTAPDNGEDHLDAKWSLGDVRAPAPARAGQTFVLDLVTPQAKPIDVAFEVATRPRCPRWLARLALRLGGEIKVECLVGNTDHTVGTEIVGPMPTAPPSAQYDFDIVIPIGLPTGSIRIELPARDGLAYRLDVVEFTVGSRTEAVIPSGDGHRFEAALPATTTPDSVRIAGVLR